MSYLRIMLDGTWRKDIPATPALDARLAGATTFPDRISAGNNAKYPVEAGRYHLYVSYACPWAHRTILVRSLLGLEDVVGMSVLHPDWQTRGGWTFGETELSDTDPVFGATHLHEVYARSDRHFTGKVTVPCLVDRQCGRIVNNESWDIMNMLSEAFRDFRRHRVELFPPDIAPEQLRLSRWVVQHISAAVYRVGFARNYEAFSAELAALFDALALANDRLSTQSPFLFGGRFTASDLHLFTMLFRFEVYADALRCGLRPLEVHPRLIAYRDRIAALPRVAKTLRLDHVKIHYPRNLSEIDPAIDDWLDRARRSCPFSQ